MERTWQSNRDFIMRFAVGLSVQPSERTQLAPMPDVCELSRQQRHETTASSEGNSAGPGTSTSGAAVGVEAGGQVQPHPEVACQICSGVDSRPGDEIILCDGCDGAYHMMCLPRPLAAIPEHEWFCPGCAASRKFGPAHEFSMDLSVGTALWARDKKQLWGQARITSVAQPTPPAPAVSTTDLPNPSTAADGPLDLSVFNAVPMADAVGSASPAAQEAKDAKDAKEEPARAPLSGPSSAAATVATVAPQVVPTRVKVMPLRLADSRWALSMFVPRVHHDLLAASPLVASSALSSHSSLTLILTLDAALPALPVLVGRCRSRASPRSMTSGFSSAVAGCVRSPRARHRRRVSRMSSMSSKR